MAWLQDTSLRNKLIFGIMAISGVALILVSGVFVIRDAFRLRSDTAAQLDVLAAVVADNSASAMIFQDVESALETLRTVRADDGVLCAHLFNDARVPFATYVRKDGTRHDHPATVRGRDGHHWTWRGLEVVAPVLQDAERVGTVQIYSGLGKFWTGLLFTFATVVLILLGALGLVFLLSGYFQSIITDPVLRLVKTARRVSEARDFSVRAEPETGVEIKLLVDGFNEMLEEVELRDRERQGYSERLEEEVAQRTSELTLSNQDLMGEISEREKVEAEREVLTDRLMEAARKAGQAEVATGVLHNVGNVLNSVNVSATILDENLRDSRVAGLIKGVEMLRQHADDLPGFFASDPRAAKLPGYLAQVAEKLEAERVEAREQIGSLTTDIEHIKTIVSMQQGYAKGAGLLERLTLSDAVETAISINRNSLERHGVELIREWSEIPQVETDRHKVIQIAVNLVSNAIHALKHNAHGDRRITTRIEARDDQVARLRVTDNGMGLDEAALTRIFQYGYTTRDDGHGFGLHSGALAATQLGGSLSVSSDGPDRGAVFTLELPFRCSEQKV